jgi:hypothetical protein
LRKKRYHAMTQRVLRHRQRKCQNAIRREHNRVDRARANSLRREFIDRSAGSKCDVNDPTCKPRHPIMY